MKNKSPKLLYLIPDDDRYFLSAARHFVYEGDQKETVSADADEIFANKEENDKKKEDVEAEARKKAGGVPINAGAEENEEKSVKEAEALAKTKLDSSEKKIKDKYGGEFYEMGDLPGLEGSKSEVHVNIPKDLDKYVDKDGKRIKPRVVYFCGHDYVSGEQKKIFDMVEQMRKNGDPVVLVMPRDMRGNWKDFDDPKACQKIMEHTEKLLGESVSSISMSSFSAGYRGVTKALMGLQKSTDPKAKEIYGKIRQIGFCDSFYGGEENIEAVSEWAASNPRNRLNLYWTKYAHAGRNLLMDRIKQKFEKLGRALNNMNLESGPYPGGHGIDSDKVYDYMKRPPEEPGDTVTADKSTKSDEKADEEKDGKETEGHSEGINPNIPPRSPDAMSGKEFQAAYEKVQNNPKERQKLILEQLAKGNVPANYRFFEPITIKQGDQTITIHAAKRGITIGDGDDTFEIPLDGPTSRAVADMYNCTMPTSWLSDQIYQHAKERGHVVPLCTQDEFAHHDGTRMQRMDWMRKQQEYGKYREDFSKMPPDALVAGYFKDVVHPVPGVPAKYPDGVEIYGGYDRAGRRIQPLSGRHHNESYVDYSHRTRLISRTAYINGKKVDLGELMKDPKIAREFGFTPTDIDKSYDYSTWSNQYDAAYAKGVVDAYKKAYPPGGGPAGQSPSGGTAVAQNEAAPVTGSAGDKPTITAEGEDSAPSAASATTTGGGDSSSPATSPSASPPSSQTAGGSVSPSPAPSGGSGDTGSSAPSSSATASPGVQSPSSSPVEAGKETTEKINKNKVFVLGDSLSEGAGPRLKLQNMHAHWKQGRDVKTMREIFEKIPASECSGSTLYVLGGGNDLFNSLRSMDDIKGDLIKIYALAKQRGMKVITATYPPMGNSTYIGKEPNSVKTEMELRERWDNLNNWILSQEGKKDGDKQIGPDKVIQYHKIFADASDRFLMRADARAADGIHMTPQGYTEMAGHITDTVIQYEEKSIGETAPTAVPSGSSTTTGSYPKPDVPVSAEKSTAIGLQKAKNPFEFAKINTVPPINGSTAFFGDSINTGITRSKYLQNQGHEYFAKGGERTPWLLRMVNSVAPRLSKFQNAVVLIGTNDIGMGGKETPDLIFGRITQIWDAILKANPSINLHVCTIPPFGNYDGYRSRKNSINQRREEINAKIRQAAQNNPRLKLIDLCLPVDKGGLATADGSALDPSVSYEPLHPEKNALAMVYGRAINSSK